MAARIDILKRLSGGAGNTDPNASLGGVMSTTTKVLSQTATFDGGGISGVTLNQGLGHLLPGVGTLTFDFAATTLVWDPGTAGGSAGAAVDVSLDGDYVIPAAPDVEYLRVSVVAASLPVANDNDTVTIANEQDNFFNLVGGVEAALGSTAYRCFYVLNDAGAGDALNTRVWITKQPSASPTLMAIGLDPAGINGTATTIANENAVPAGVAFSTPVTEGTALMIGNLTPGDFAAVWIRRTVPVNTIASDADDDSEITIGVSF